jgi:hypothetical protein
LGTNAGEPQVTWNFPAYYRIAASKHPWQSGRRPPKWGSWRGRFCVNVGLVRHGGKMELRTRLNVLAAIISFAFLTAVVFGMF